jgi:hypothetical protein
MSSYKTLSTEELDEHTKPYSNKNTDKSMELWGNKFKEYLCIIGEVRPLLEQNEDLRMDHILSFLLQV